MGATEAIHAKVTQGVARPLLAGATGELWTYRANGWLGYSLQIGTRHTHRRRGLHPKDRIDIALELQLRRQHSKQQWHKKSHIHPDRNTG